MKKIKKENSYLVELITELQKEQRPIWRRIAELLAKPRRQRVEVNVSKLQVYADQGMVVVPGKVLGSGELNKKIHVAAFAFSETARQTINSAGGKTLSIEELKQMNPEGKGVLILT